MSRNTTPKPFKPRAAYTRTAPAKEKVSPEMERQFRAVRNMQKLLPTVNSFAQAIAPGRNLRVELTAGTPNTNGKVIRIQVPPEMGDSLIHTRQICGQRDQKTKRQMCAACDKQERIYRDLIHEVAHLVFETFAEVSASERKQIIDRALRQGAIIEGSRQQKLRAMIDAKPSMGYMEAASLISEFMPFLLNCLEDARVNRMMFEARPGVKDMFLADMIELGQLGVPHPDGTRKLWSEYTPNMQASLAMFCAASDYDWATWFSPEIVALMEDKKLARLVGQVKNTTGVKSIYSLTFPIIERARELGFFKRPDDIEDDKPEPPPAPPVPSEQERATEPESEPEATCCDQEEDQESADEESDESEQEETGNPDSNSDSGESEDDESEKSPDTDEATNGQSDPEDDSSDSSEDIENDEESDIEEEESKQDENYEDDYEQDELDWDQDDSDHKPDTETETDAAADPTADDAADDSPQGDGMGDETTEGDGDADTGDTAVKSHCSGSQDDDSDEDDDYELQMLELGDDGKYYPAEEEPESEGHDPVGSDVDDALDELQELMELLGQHIASDDNGPDELLMQIALNQASTMEEPSVFIKEVIVHDWNRPTYRTKDMGWPCLSGAYRPNPQRFMPDEGMLVGALTTLRPIFADNKKAKQEHEKRSGRVVSSRLASVPTGNTRVFQRQTLPGKKDYFVILALDISGSTTGEPIDAIKEMGMAMGELLSRCGVKFAIYAHSGKSLGLSRDGTGHSALDVFEVKGETELWSEETKTRLAALDSCGANLDGHMMEFCRRRIAESTATNKILFYCTDGEMPAWNFNEEYHVLVRELKELKHMAVDVVGIGVETDSPIQYGLDTIRIDNSKDVYRLVNELKKRLAV